MIFCDNKRCKWCFIDGDDLVCDGDPTFRGIPDARVFIRHCLTYKHRPRDESVQQLDPLVDENGLYDGQIKPPVDYSDFDPETIDDPPPAAAGSSSTNIAEEPECDT